MPTIESDDSPMLGGDRANYEKQTSTSNSPSLTGMELLFHALEVAGSKETTLQQRLDATELIGQYDHPAAVSYMFELLKKGDYRFPNRAQAAIAKYDPQLVIPLILQNISSRKKSEKSAAIYASLAIGQNFLPVVEGILNGSILPDSREFKTKEAQRNAISRAKVASLYAFGIIAGKMVLLEKVRSPQIENIVNYLFEELNDNRVNDDDVETFVIALVSVGTPDIGRRIFEYTKWYFNLNNYMGISAVDTAITLRQCFPNKDIFVASEASDMLATAFDHKDLGRMTFAIDVMSKTGIPEKIYEIIPDVVDYLEKRDSVELLYKDRFRYPMKTMLRALGVHGTKNAIPMLISLGEKYRENLPFKTSIENLSERSIARICSRSLGDAYEFLYEPLNNAIRNPDSRNIETAENILNTLGEHGSLEIVEFIENIEQTINESMSDIAQSTGYNDSLKRSELMKLRELIVTIKAGIRSNVGYSG